MLNADTGIFTVGTIHRILPPSEWPARMTSAIPGPAVSRAKCGMMMPTSGPPAAGKRKTGYHGIRGGSKTEPTRSKALLKHDDHQSDGLAC